MEKRTMKINGDKQNIILIGVILGAAVFNCTPFFLLDNGVKQEKRKNEDLSGEDKHEKN